MIEIIERRVTQVIASNLQGDCQRNRPHQPLGWRALVYLAVILCTAPFALTRSARAVEHRVILQGNGRLVILAPDGNIEWECPWQGIHDLHRLANGNLLVQQGKDRVVEIDHTTKQVVWTYDAAQQNGNAGREIEVHAFQPVADGRLMIAETNVRRIIEVDRQGKLLHQIPLIVDRPHPHTDTRLVRKIPTADGRGATYLVCHEGDGKVREYAAADGRVVWEYEIPLFGKEPAEGHGPEAFGNKVFSAVRLPNGHTLIGTGNGHSVLEVTPDKQIVWQLHQHDLPGITLAWVTTLQVLANGHLVIGNCHAGPGQPLLVEVDRATKSVVWTLDRFDDFGNSVSNSLVLE